MGVEDRDRFIKEEKKEMNGRDVWLAKDCCIIIAHIKV